MLGTFTASYSRVSSLVAILPGKAYQTRLRIFARAPQPHVALRSSPLPHHAAPAARSLRTPIRTGSTAHRRRFGLRKKFPSAIS